MTRKSKNLCVRILRTIQAKQIEADELGKAKSFRLFSIARPYMRSFHASWFCFFVAFTSWFGIQPLLPTIRKELGLTKVQLAHSGIASISATIAVRVFIGPLCDKFGPKRVMALILFCGAIPMALAGLVKDAIGLIILRLFIGLLGGSFVPCQFWTTAMFNVNVVGTANALVGGWGNLGGGFTFILMPGLFELVKICGADEFLAWKIAVAIPAFICIVTGLSILFTSDDCPQGKWDLRVMPEIDIDITADDTDDDNVSVSGEKKDKSTDEQDQDKINDRKEIASIQENKQSNGISNDHTFEKDKTSPPKNDSFQHRHIKHLQNKTEQDNTHQQRRKSIPLTQIGHNRRKRSSLQYETPEDFSTGKINPAFDSSEEGFQGQRKHTLTSISEVQVEENNGGEDKKHACRKYGFAYLSIAILVIQYGMCFGVEISVNTVMNLYFLYRFKIEGCVETNAVITNNATSTLNASSTSLFNTTMSTLTTLPSNELNSCSILNQNQASLIASLFGLMNLFARALGGIFSDVLRKYYAIPGRIFALFICLFCEGCLLIVFSQMTTIPTAIVAMVFFSLFVQMSEGATFAVVPYVILRRVGVVAGLVGAGGNLGAVIWNAIWSELVAVDPSRYFWIVGIVVLCGSFLSFLITVQDSRLIPICRSKKEPEPQKESTHL